MLTKSRETFHFNPLLSIEGSWMVGLVSLEVYNSFFNITEENNKFKVYKFPDSKIGGISSEKVRDEIEKDLGISDITTTDLQDDIKGPIINNEYRQQVTKRVKIYKFMGILSSYTSSKLRNFERYLRTESDLVEVDIRLVLDKHNLSFITFEILPGIHTFKDISEVCLSFLQSENEGYHNAVDTELDNLTMKTKLVLRAGIIAIRLMKNRFLILSLVSTIVGIINTITNTLAKKM